MKLKAAARRIQPLFSAAAIFMYQLSLSIKALPKSLNSRDKVHWATRHRQSKEWAYEINALCAGKKPPKPLEKARITLIRHSYRMLDYDGAVGSMKPVVDALVTCGILKDDSWSVTGPWHVSQIFKPKKEGALLEILIESF